MAVRSSSVRPERSADRWRLDDGLHGYIYGISVLSASVKGRNSVGTDEVVCSGRHRSTLGAAFFALYLSRAFARALRNWQKGAYRRACCLLITVIVR